MSTAPVPADRATVPVTLRYWAAARAAAGVDEERQSGATVGEVLQAASEAHPELGRVLSVSSILLDGRPATADALLAEGLVLEVLPPFAGG